MCEKKNNYTENDNDRKATVVKDRAMDPTNVAEREAQKKTIFLD